jgi:hypothetical protein
MQVVGVIEEKNEDGSGFFGIIVFRGVNNSNITKHRKNSFIKVVPMK